MKSKYSHLAKKLLFNAKIDSPPVPIEAIARKQGITIEHAVLKENISGLLIRETDEAIIAVNTLHPLVRQRFTIAHELGHYLLDHKGRMFVDKGSIIFRSNGLGNNSDEDEIAANKFAAEILMPAEMIIAELEKNAFDLEDPMAVEELANKFEVSTQALTYRLVNLRLVH